MKRKPTPATANLIAQLGMKLRRRREALGLTLERLAEYSGVSPNYIGTIENGRRDPGLSVIKALADGLDSSLSELFELPPKRTPLSPAALEVARLFCQVPEEMQTGVLMVLSALAKIQSA
jgi:XRE family transcriptional regulator, fatty acid utilization regulator